MNYTNRLNKKTDNTANKNKRTLLSQLAKCKVKAYFIEIMILNMLNKIYF